MLHKTLLFVMCILSLPVPGYSQIVREQNGGYGSSPPPQPTNTATAEQIGNAVAAALFGGGEIPVRDSTVRTKTTLSLIELLWQTSDMIIQALLGGGPDNESTGGLIAAQAEYGQSGSILYGQYSPDLWMDTYKEDIVYRHGEWVEDETIRDHRRLTTAMDNMMLFKMRQDAFEQDLAHLDEVKDAIDGCAGRNCAIQAAGDATVSMAKHQLQTQQLLMTVGTLLANQFGGEVNDVTQKRAQQRYAVTNGGVSPQLVQWVNRGW